LKTTRWSCALLVAAALVLSQERAWADGAITSEAELRFNEAKALAKLHRNEEALAKYMQSYSLEPRASTLLGMALTESELGRHVEATRHLREYLKNPKAQNTDEIRTNVLGPLLEKTGHVRVKVPAGLQLLVDDAPTTAIDDTVDVKPGAHVFAAASERREITVAKGQTVEVDLVLPPRDASGPAPTAPPLTDAPPAEEPKPSAARTIVPVALGVGAAVGIGLGVGFSLAQKSSLDDADALRKSQPDLCADPTSPACRSRDDKLSTAKTQGTLSFVSYGVGIAAGAACVATILFWPKASKTGQLQITPVVGSTTAGVHLSKSF